jgi:hypothetical protein
VASEPQSKKWIEKPIAAGKLAAEMYGGLSVARGRGQVRKMTAPARPPDWDDAKVMKAVLLKMADGNTAG